MAAPAAYAVAKVCGSVCKNVGVALVKGCRRDAQPKAGV